jgi:hypothetical protein
MTNKEYLKNVFTLFQHGSIIYNVNKTIDCYGSIIQNKRNVNGIIEFKKNKKIKISVGEIDSDFKVKESYEKDDLIVFMMNDFFKTITVYLVFNSNEDVNNCQIQYARAIRHGFDLNLERAIKEEFNSVFHTY